MAPCVALRAPLPTQLIRSRRARTTTRTTVTAAQQNQSKLNDAVKVAKGPALMGAATLGAAAPADAAYNTLLGLDVADLFASPAATIQGAVQDTVEAVQNAVEDLVPEPLGVVPEPVAAPVELPKVPEITLPDVDVVAVAEEATKATGDLFTNFSKGFKTDFGLSSPAKSIASRSTIPEVPQPKPFKNIPEVPEPKPFKNIPEVPEPKPIKTVPEVSAPKPVEIEITTPEPPKIEMVAPEPPKIEIVAPEPSNLELSEMPKLELPEMPKMEFPKVELPTVELPKVELPTVDTSAATEAISGAKSAFVKEFTKEFEGAINIFDSVKKSTDSAVSGTTGAVGGAVGGAKDSVDAAIDGIKGSVDSSIGSAATEVSKYLPDELNDLVVEASKNADLAVAAATVFIGTPLLLLLVTKLVAASGYAGEKTPAQVLETLMAQNALLIDVRSEREIVSAGVPDLRGSSRGRVRVIEPEPLDKAVSREINNAGAVETQIFAARVKALAGGRREVYVMDTADGSSKALARAISRQGGVRAYTMKGGFNAWVKDDLRVKANYNVNIGQFLSEEAEDITSPFVEGTALSISSISNTLSEDPVALYKYALGALAAGIAVYNYETVLQYIGVWGLITTVGIKSLNSEGGLGDMIADVRTSTAGAMESATGALATAQSTLGEAKELATTVSSKVKTATEKGTADEKDGQKTK